jgi:4-hydroxyproline epimerase
MFEPRGHDMMSGSILYPPADAQNDAAVLFIETSGCLPMCGHGTIGTVTIAIEQGLVQPKSPGRLMLETPAGLVAVTYEQENGKVRWVRLTNVPSYLHAEGLPVECPDLGPLTVDVAYGGNFYAIVDPQANFKGLEHYRPDQLIAWSPVLRKRLNDSYAFHHPLDPLIKDLSHILWTGATISPTAHARNAVFYGEKALDRSPCGTGTSARMAQWHAKGLLNQGADFIHESIIGSQFVGRIDRVVPLADKTAVIPSIQGWAKITGYNHIIIDDEDDPYAHGFQVI